jgi:hypothetical protein
MYSDARTRLAAVAALSLLCLAGAATRADARIELDNDVVLDWGICPDGAKPNCGQGSVIGAPRLVRNFDFSTTSLRITVLAGADPVTGVPPTSVDVSFLDLVLRRADMPECLESNSRGCVYRLHLAQLTAGQSQTIDVPFSRKLSDFTSTLVRGDVIITVESQIAIVNAQSAAGVPVTITLSGEGNEVSVDRVGDVGFHAGDAADVPTRSVDLLRALEQLESSFLPRRELADPDTALPRHGEVAVGFTHAVSGALNVDRIHEAILTLRLKRESGDFGNDFILLDRGVRDVAGGQPRVALIYLRDLQPPASSAPVFTAPDTYDFTLDLGSVPVTVQLVGGEVLSSQSRSVVNDLRDGRLNVVVVGRSSVDYSDLTVTLEDSRHQH